jgi:adenine-specific DNA-methyltransferase
MTDEEKLRLLKKIEDILKEDDRLWNEEKTDLNQTLLLDLTEKLDENIIGLLYRDEDIRKKFFLKINDVYIFKNNDFKFFLEDNKIDNSYTKYKNRIGLTDGKRFLKDTEDVVLDFPYKDCVLEGGQTTEEGTDTYYEYSEKEGKYEEKEGKRKEIFFNQVLAQDEIDRLFDEKALVGWKRYSKDGEEDVVKIKRDEKGIIRDNFIIKSNNLLALHSLKNQFAGKIKFIYIDPPYNLKGDNFAYNDNFNHSTWLTFMKNRLEVAKELLCDDGIIFVHIDYNEQAYLEILMDEIFLKENSLPHITIKTATPAGFKVINPGLVNVAEHVLIYTKGNKKIIRDGYVESSYQRDYKYVILNVDDDTELWNIKNIKDVAINKLGLGTEKEIIKKYGKKIAKLLIQNEIENYAINNPKIIFATYGPHKPSKRLKEGIVKSKANPDKIILLPDEKGNNYYLLNGRLLAFYENKLKNIDGKLVPCKRMTDFWDDISWDSIASEGGVTLKNGKKPERLLKRLIELTINEGDIVLDFFLGCGTTCAVSHKMGLQYIGIEQLDYGKNDAIMRLQNVINGDQSGISKIVNWQGGGDFIYFELAKWNEQAKEEILACENLDELLTLFDSLYEKYFLNYNLKIKEFKEKVIEEENFRDLSLDEQKKMFLTMLDLNQMYVQRSEMADAKYGISEEDQKLTTEFYDGG